MNHVLGNLFKSPVVLSLCPGMLGLERGLERAFKSLWYNGGSEGNENGTNKNDIIKVAAYIEIEAFICFNLVKQMEQGVLAPAPLWLDLKTFPYNSFHGKIHGFVGGYPCQPFSGAGLRKGEGDPRHLWPFIREGVRATQPLWCFFENVAGHLTLGYETVRRELQELGYKVEEGIFTAEEVGAPHKRERLFILAIKKGVGLAHSYGVGSLHGQSGIYSEERRVDALSNTSASDKNELGTEKRGVCLADTSSNHAERNSKTEESTELIETSKRLEQRRNQMDTGVGLADPCEFNVEGNKQEFINKKIRQEQRERQVRSQSISRWPARPGNEQYDWEYPRTECGMDFTAHGYNFREDLLRMAGNGVVEQTAELAFITLLNKHLND